MMIRVLCLIMDLVYGFLFAIGILCVQRAEQSQTNADDRSSPFMLSKYHVESHGSACMFLKLLCPLHAQYVDGEHESMPMTLSTRYILGQILDKIHEETNNTTVDHSSASRTGLRASKTEREQPRGRRLCGAGCTGIN